MEKKLFDKNRLDIYQHYLKSQDELKKLYQIYKKLSRIITILEFHFKPKKSKPILPSIANKENKSQKMNY